MATITAYATTVTDTDTGSGTEQPWSGVGGTLTEGCGATSDGTTKYAESVIDLIPGMQDRTGRLTLSGFDFSSIPSTATLNSVTYSYRIKALQILDTLTIPNDSNTTHSLRFYLVSGTAALATYTGTSNCRSKEVRSLSSSYQTFSRTMNAASDTANYTLRAGSFFTIARLRSPGIAAAFGVIDDTALDENTPVWAYDFKITVDYTPVATLKRRRKARRLWSIGP